MNDLSNSGSEVATLRNQVFTLFLALIVVSGTVTTYMFYQSRQLGKQLALVEQSLENLKKNEASIDAFVGQLVEYGKRDPNFQQQVLKKYLPANVINGQTAVPAAPKK